MNVVMSKQDLPDLPMTISPEYEELTKESGRRWRILVKEVNEKA